MTIFARRRLQSMLDELSPHLSEAKAKDMVARLNKEWDVDQALPAEMEIALIWALSKLGGLEIEPDWWPGGRAPDAVTDGLVDGRQAAIEIVAAQDRSLVREPDMEKVAAVIVTLANSIRQGLGEYLHFHFHAELRWVGSTPTWFLAVPKSFEPSTYTTALLSQWIHSGRYSDAPLVLSEGELKVVISHKKYKPSQGFRCISKMPPSVYSLVDNPLFKLLKRKARQIKSAPKGVLRIIFLADVGSHLVSRIGKEFGMDALRRKFSGSEIIKNFLRQESGCVDGVVTFSPRDDSNSGSIQFSSMPPKRYWEVSFFGTDLLPSPPQSLASILSLLPPPRYDGTTSRSHFRQGRMRHSGKGQYRGMSVTMGAPKGEFKLEMSARMFLDLLSGRLSREEFYRYTNGDGNIIAHWLDMGLTIREVRVAERTLDKDDDKLIIIFTDDPAARPFRIPNAES